MNLPLASLAGVVFGAAAAAAIALMPAPMLESLVMDSGIPAVVSAAAPPLGMTARLAIAAGAGAAVGLIAWFALFLLLGTRGLSIGRAASPHAVPVIRRADAHPDAPPRMPLLATRDLGTPFLEVPVRAPKPSEPPAEKRYTPVHLVAPAVEPEMPLGPMPVAEAVAAPAPEPMPLPRPEAVYQPEPEPEPVFEPEPDISFDEQALPLNLDQPLSAYDPDAIRDVPMPPPVKLPPLRPRSRPAVFDARERFETFELTPIRRGPVQAPTPLPAFPREEAIARPETDATIHALLERLERGVVRRGLATAEPQKPRDAERGLEEALVTLRNLARRA